MYDIFFENFNKKVPLLKEEEAVIESFLSFRKLRKNQYMLQEGSDCKFLAFVRKGALRQYSTDESGNIHIFQFATEGWTISDLYSFLTGEPSIYNIVAVEDAELVLIERTAHEKLLKEVPKYETFTRLQLTGAYLSMQRRLNSSISLTPEDRYLEFTTSYPDFAQRFPQHMVASYLGLQPETLSRIRRKLARP
jgi:CRP-like cAMP-binding protein